MAVLGSAVAVLTHILASGDVRYSHGFTCITDSHCQVREIIVCVFLGTAVLFYLWKIKLNKLYRKSTINDCSGWWFNTFVFTQWHH